jgi:isoleucyl-tRNA synthetase
MGHAFNRSLKDMIMKYQRLAGKFVPFIPGWDCHGLPIEWKVEEGYRKKGKNKDDIPVAEFRQECRDYAEHWINVQRESMKKLGIFGSWNDPYLTMNYESESLIVGELHKFLMNGGLYRGAKPVQWSVVEKTALAEAEVEYYDKVSPTIYVTFPIIKSSIEGLKNTKVVIWTTTPWTIPANRAIAFHDDVIYVQIQITEVNADKENVYASPDDCLLVAEDLLEKFTEDCGIDNYNILEKIPGNSLEGSICHHPLNGKGYDFDVPLLHGDHVTTEQGTGFVHTAPSHGLEDFELGKKHNLEIPELVGEDGTYHKHVPLFAGLHVYKANDSVIEALIESAGLLYKAELKHSYPHSWRSKAPLIYRCTSQWFISMDRNDLRNKALTAIESTNWLPKQSKNRIKSMIEGRPDWCISRQRPWGVPIAIFTNKETGQPLMDDTINQRIQEIFKEEGSDAWFKRPAQDFLNDKYAIEDYDQVRDVVDVWFEAGVTHEFVLNHTPSLKYPADLYLEGSDQHRGWFQSSLLTACSNKGNAPFKTVLTHGFLVDENGRKMSKSLGNAITLDEIVQEYGADILRLWVIGSDFSDDLKLGHELLKRYQDIYRRLRNTLRYLLGNLESTESIKEVPYEELPELEKWVLHRLSTLDTFIRQKTHEFDLHDLFIEVYNFCAIDLSSFYFDIRKDALYCDADDSLVYRSCITVLRKLFDTLTIWLSPVISFTTEEAWITKNGEGSSVHLQEMPAIPKEWHQDALGKKWDIIRQARRVITGALELARSEGKIGSSLQAYPEIYIEDKKVRDILESIDIPELCITSDAKLKEGKKPEGLYTHEALDGIFVDVKLATGNKCDRCWKILEEVDKNKSEAYCNRCHKVVS